MCIRYPSYDITMTGHSLGGAIASLAALDAIKPGGYLSNLRHPSQINLYTMGAPRVGNRVVASIVNDAGFGQVYRVVNYSDPVPHLVSFVLDVNLFSSHLRLWDIDIIEKRFSWIDLGPHGIAMTISTEVKIDIVQIDYHPWLPLKRI